MVEGVPALHDVHYHLGEAQVVLGEQRVDSDRLDHIIHEEESLGVLEAALRQVPPGASLLQCATLQPGRRDQCQAVTCFRVRRFLFNKRLNLGPLTKNINGYILIRCVSTRALQAPSMSAGL